MTNIHLLLSWRNLRRFFGSAILAFCVIAAQSAVAQLEEFQARNPYVVTGQMFTVRVVPAGKKMQVYVAGNEISQLQFDKLHLVASFKAGNRSWTVDAGKKKEHFLIEAPSDLPAGIQPELKLKLRYENKAEDFDVKMNSKK